MTNTRRPAAKAADDKPFDFNLDTAKVEADLTPFRVHWAGQRWEFAHMQSLDLWELVAGAAQGDLGATVATFKAALGEERFKEFRKIPLPQGKANSLFEAYAEHCGVDLGELQGSTGS
jgi:hypothetical protein